jgi:hypothetical protein
MKLLTKKQLRDALGLSSTRIIDSWIRKRMIPVINAGWRTKLFDLDRVRVALDRYEIKEVGRK